VKQLLTAWCFCLAVLARSTIADQRAADAAFQRATAAFNNGKLEEAEKQAEDAEKAGYKKPEAPYLLGAIYTRQKRYDEAVNQFNQALAIDPKFSAAKLYLAEAELLQGKYAEAVKDYEALKVLDPESEVVDFKLVLCFLLEGDDARASVTADVMKFPGKTPAYYYARAAIALKHGEKDAAQRYFESAKKYYADNQCRFFVQSLKEVDLLASNAQ
jgi:tetratricopeptide (TPR) repeat protein